MFDETILARMIADYRKGATGLQRIPHRRERSLEPSEFVIHCDADRLEDAGKVPWPRAGSQYRTNGAHEVIGRLKRAIRPAPNHLGCESSRLALVGILPEGLRQLLLFYSREPGSGGGSVRPHSHVEGRALTKREATLLIVELTGGDPEVEQDEIGLELRDGPEGLRRTVGGLQRFEAGVTDPRGGDGDRLGIAVDTEEDLRTLGQKGGRMSAMAQCPVDHSLRAGGEGEDLRQEDREMAGRRDA